MPLKRNLLKRKKQKRTLIDAPTATGRTMKGHLTASSRWDMRCCRRVYIYILYDIQLK